MGWALENNQYGKIAPFGETEPQKGIGKRSTMVFWTCGHNLYHARILLHRSFELAGEMSWGRKKAILKDPVLRSPEPVQQLLIRYGANTEAEAKDALFAQFELKPCDNAEPIPPALCQWLKELVQNHLQGLPLLELSTLISLFLPQIPRESLTLQQTCFRLLDYMMG